MSREDAPKPLATRLGQARCAIEFIAQARGGDAEDALLLVADELERLEEIADEEYGPIAPDEPAEIAPVIVLAKPKKKAVSK